MKLEKEYPTRVRVQIQEHKGRKLIETKTFMIYESSASEVEALIKKAIQEYNKKEKDLIGQVTPSTKILRG